MTHWLIDAKEGSPRGRWQGMLWEFQFARLAGMQAIHDMDIRRTEKHRPNNTTDATNYQTY